MSGLGWIMGAIEGGKYKAGHFDQRTSIGEAPQIRQQCIFILQVFNISFPGQKFLLSYHVMHCCYQYSHQSCHKRHGLSTRGNSTHR